MRGSPIAATVRGALRSGTAVVVLGAVLVLGGCGEDPASDDRSEARPTELVLELDGDASGIDVDGDTDVLRRRLAALAVDGSVVAEGDTITISVPADDAALVRSTLVSGRLEFRPVLADADPSTAVTTPTEAVRSDAPATLVDGDGIALVLGPSALTGAAVERAEATTAGGQPAVALVLRDGPDGIDAFNGLAADCYAAAPECPSVVDGLPGRIAIVLDGKILSAPTIQTDRFERDQIQLSGSFTDEQAAAMAAVLDGGGLDGAWTVRD